MNATADETATAQSELPFQPCRRCGALGVDARADDAIVVLACPRCGEEEPWIRLPFFSVTGASGSGKSTLVRKLWRELPECTALDGDALWEPRFWDDRAAFYNRWLVLAAHISQSSRPLVLCTAAMPDDWSLAPQRILLKDVHMLALVCDEDDLLARLATRNRDRGPGAPDDFIEQTRTFNRWLREHLPHVDTSSSGEDETAQKVATWVRSHL